MTQRRSVVRCAPAAAVALATFVTSVSYVFGAGSADYTNGHWWGDGAAVTVWVQ
jgi:hypothetical protein